MTKELYITSMASHSWGGSEELWVQMARNAKMNGNTVAALIFDWGKVPEKIIEIEKKGVTLYKRKRFQYQDLIKKPWGKFIEKTLALKELNKAVKHFKPEKLVMSMGGFCDLEVDVNRTFLFSTGVPYDLIIHANPENYYPAFRKVPDIIKACKKAETVYFVSKRLKEIAIRQTGFNFPNGKIIVNPVNMKEVGILPWPETECLNFACVGRLEAKVKGQAILLQALSQPEWKERKWHLNFYGKGPDEKYLQHLTKSYELNSKVTFKGHIDDIRRDIWANNQILVMPSYYEGMSIALLEAMLCGRPAVVTDVGGSIEILSEGVTGFIAEGVNLQSVNRALNRSWQAFDKLELMGEKGYFKASDYFKKNN